MTDPERSAALHYYAQLADDYHLLYRDWQASVRYEGEVLDRLIRERLRVPADHPVRVLDCSCGIGTQAIGLALAGCIVTASDVSSESVERARQEAAAVGASLRFEVADMRLLSAVGSGFDVVLSCDNALPHFLHDQELNRGIESMRDSVRRGGLILASIRDYDRAVRERLRWMSPGVYDDPGGLRVVFQVWDWSANGRTYRVHQFIVRQQDEAFETTHSEGVYRALLREELSGALETAGLCDIAWLPTEATGYPQPIVTARRP